MTDRTLHHRRLHNLLLFRKLLSSKDASSPFTLVLDSVEQSAKPLLRHFIQGAKVSKTEVVFVAYETVRVPGDGAVFVNARRKGYGEVKGEVERGVGGSRRTLVIIDSLYALCTNAQPSFSLAAFLSSLTSPTTSLLAIYHTDVPIPSPSSLSSSPNHTTPSSSSSPYTPHPLTLLRYLATTILTMHSFPQTLARKRAVEKSRSEPLFGIEEGTEGVLVGLGANDARGCVVEMEFRRKSGRGVEEWVFVPALGLGASEGGGIVLLEDQELFRREVVGEEVEVEVERGTFDLGLTEKQRREREGVVLPYFDAQKGEGGEGGRILYDMGVEDDFDEEEDEI